MSNMHACRVLLTFYFFLAAGWLYAADGVAQLSVEQLAEVVDDDSKHYAIRRAAAYELGRRGSEAAPAIEALVKALDDRQLELVWYAMDTLGRIGPEARPAVPAMVAAMQNEANDAVLRVTAAEALGRLGPAAEAALPSLREAFDHKEPAYRIAAAQAAFQIAEDDGALETLRNAMRSSEPETAYLAVNAITELGRLKSEHLPHEELTRLLGHRSADIRNAAAKAFANQGPDIVQAVIEAAKAKPVSKEKLEAAIAALRWLSEEVRVRMWENPQVDPGAVTAIESSSYGAAVPFLLDLTASGDEDIRRQTSTALASFGIYALPSLARALPKSEGQKLETQIRAIDRLLEMLPEENAQRTTQFANYRQQSAEALLEAMAHPEVTVRRTAVKAFAALDIEELDDQAREQLRKLLRDPDLRIRRYAADGLR